MFLVCGDSMEDIYIEGETSRISPEAPVPVVKFRKELKKPGGAANVFVNVQTLGLPVRGLYSGSAAIAPVQKIRVMSKGHQVVRLDYDHSQTPLHPNDFSPEDWIIFSDYGKGTLRWIEKLIALAPTSKIFIDPRGTDYQRYEGASYIKPNKEEMRDLVGGWSSEAQLDQRAASVVSHYKLEGLLLTRGEEGMTLYTKDTKYVVPAVFQEVFDVCGAGDTTIATFAVALAKGFTPGQATVFANKAAGITCQHLGSYAPTEKEVFGDTGR